MILASSISTHSESRNRSTHSKYNSVKQVIEKDVTWNKNNPKHKRYPPTDWNNNHSSHKRYHLHVDKAHAERYKKSHEPKVPINEAIASYYELAGNKTACGETLPAIGVANKTLPCGTMINICSATCLTVPVIDRGPYVEGREFDLTKTTAEAIGFPLSSGVASVKYEIMK